MITMEDKRDTTLLVLKGANYGIGSFSTTAQLISEDFIGELSLYRARVGDTVTVTFALDAVDPTLNVYIGNATVTNLLWSSAFVAGDQVTIPIPANATAITIAVTQ